MFSLLEGCQCGPSGLTVSTLRITGSHKDQQILPVKDTDRMRMMRAENKTMRIIILQTSTNTGKCKETDTLPT